MTPRGRRFLHYGIAAIWIGNLVGLYLLWPHFSAIYTFVVVTIQQFGTQIWKILIAIGSFQVFLLLKLLVTFVVMVAIFLVNLVITALPKGFLKFAFKYLGLSAAIQLYKRSPWLQGKWDRVRDWGLSYQDVIVEKTKAFWNQLHWLEKMLLGLALLPSVGIPILMLWIYDWLRVWIWRKFGEALFEKIFKYLSEREWVKEKSMAILETLRRKKTAA